MSTPFLPPPWKHDVGCKIPLDLKPGEVVRLAFDTRTTECLNIGSQESGEGGLAELGATISEGGAGVLAPPLETGASWCRFQAYVHLRCERVAVDGTVVRSLPMHMLPEPSGGLLAGLVALAVLARWRKR